MSSTVTEWPIHYSEATQLNRKQWAGTNVTVEQDGKITAHSVFKNDNQLDGDHYTALTVLMDKDKNVLAAIKQTRGLNARGWGKVVEKHLTTVGHIPPHHLANLAAIDVEHGFWDRSNDGQIWRAVITVFSELLRNQGEGSAVRP